MITILGFLKSKLFLIIGIFCAAGYLTNDAYNFVYDKGYAKRTSEYNELYNAEIKKQQLEYDKKLKTSLNIISIESKEALNRAKNDVAVEFKTEKVIQYVDKIVVKNECNDLANHVVWVLSESTNTISDSAKGSTEANYRF